jgi:hypothetical protein
MLFLYYGISSAFVASSDHRLKPCDHFPIVGSDSDSFGYKVIAFISSRFG